ncbi:subunit 17 of mediator complex-domain-containing protein [Xylariomycetidae sp. FL0641]|nr:subunit 17 of mediator complex-domain-containing protein [Xylariomycetidae sp. FL0641]
MSGNSSPFSLRPWPTNDKKPKNLAEFIARINTERAGFRNVTEAQLREELQSQDEGRMDLDEPPPESESDDDNDVDRSKSIVVAREEFLRNIEAAYQTSLLGLDMVSLLLTKESPVQAGATLSPALRDFAGIGTLGATKLKESTITPAQTENDLAVAFGWRVMDINKMVDSVVSAAERLEKEIDLETKYWAEVLSVSEEGWAVCRLPQEPQTLGVRFGFSESAPEFRDNSLAPMRRADDGSVVLGIGQSGATSQRVRLTTKKNGVVIDQSPLPGRLPDNAPLKDRVLEARNNIFDQELWYELNREARILLSSDVYYNGSAIVWKQNEHTELIFTLEDLGEPDSSGMDLSRCSCSCVASYCYVQFLLFQAHRHNYFRRTSVSNLKGPPSNQPYNIIRALIGRLAYVEDIDTLDGFLEDLVLTLRRAGNSIASYSSTILNVETTKNPENIMSRHNPKMEVTWINQLVGRLTSVHTLTITPEARIWTLSLVTVAQFITNVYYLTLKDPSYNKVVANTYGIPFKPDEKPVQVYNPLESSYPPFEGSRDPYPSLKDVTEYLRQATIRALAQKTAETVASRLGRNDIDWAETIRGTAVVDQDEREAVLSFSSVDGKLMLNLDAQWYTGKNLVSHRWTWSAHGAGGTTESLENVVAKIMTGSV